MAAETDVDRRFIELRTDVKDGFREVNGKLDNLVTRGEHNAEVRRLDGRIDGHDTQFKAHSLHAKWAIGLGVSVGALVIAGVGIIINLIT